MGALKLACATRNLRIMEKKVGKGIVMREFFRQWRENWTWVDTVMASLTAAVFVSSVELTLLKLVL